MISLTIDENGPYPHKHEIEKYVLINNKIVICFLIKDNKEGLEGDG